MNIHVPNTGSLRHNTEMEILEQPLEWLRSFQNGWLAHLEKTGQMNWDLYSYPRNRFTPSAGGVKLVNSRLLLISSAGAFHPQTQRPFDCMTPLGDYSLRELPSNAPLDKLALAHPYFDRQHYKQDPQVILPLKHLQALADEHFIGSLAPTFISFCGYQPHAIRVVKELIPAILKKAKALSVQAVLIVPVGPLCTQSAGLIARALEVNNIAATLTTWQSDMAFRTAPPRFTTTLLPSGSPIGIPGDEDQQRRILTTTLKLLEHDAPTGPIRLNESAPI